MPERRGGAGNAGIADENVEPAVALMQRRTQPRDAVEVGEIERHQGRSSAVVADLVVEFFQASLRSRHRNHMRAGFSQRARRGIADAARGAGDAGEAGGGGQRNGCNSEASYTVSYGGWTRVSIPFARAFHETRGCRVIGERKRRR